MKQLKKVKNSDLSLRLNLNYNNVYSRLRMLLGSKATLFADLSAKSTWTWFADDDADYICLTDAPKAEADEIYGMLSDVMSKVHKEIEMDKELAPYADDLLDIPDDSFVFYRKKDGGYKVVLAGWGCRFAHQASTDTSSFIKRIPKPMPEEPVVEGPKKPSLSEMLNSLGATKQEQPTSNVERPSTSNSFAKETGMPVEKTVLPISDNATKSVNLEEDVLQEEPKKQRTSVRVLNHNNVAVKGEKVVLRSSLGEKVGVTSDNGIAVVGDLPYGEIFSVTFPSFQSNPERSFEVIPGVDTYDAYIKKLVKFSPVLFIEDQNGNAVQDYNVKVVVNGIETVYNSGPDGVIQMPTMQEGQKFVVIDTANYANTEEYSINQNDAKTPYHFQIRRAESSKVGITVLDKSGKPIPGTTINLSVGDMPCQAITDEKGRAAFPSNLFTPGDIPTTLNIKGQGTISSNLRYEPDVSEYTIQLRNKKKNGGAFDWKWLSLIPVLLLLGWGGHQLYKHLSDKTPSVKELETGVVLIQTLTSYTVDCSVDGITWLADGKPIKFYFAYDDNQREIIAHTNIESNRPWTRGFGTGFLVSEDGLIATNRHIANPVPPKEAAQAFKKRLADDQSNLQDELDNLNDWIRDASVLRLKYPNIIPLFSDSIRKQKELEDKIRTLDRILKLGSFKVEVENHCSVAFVNSIIETWDDFIGCSLRTDDDVAENYDKDVAIIQLKNKNRDVPEGAFIFDVPEKDLMDGDIPDNYEITVLGYNEGINLADIKNGIHPQVQSGKIVSNNNKYKIGYSASTLPGSSGSPVYNNKGQLVAINNSGISNTQGFNYGIRTKYLRELLDQVQKKTTK